MYNTLEQIKKRMYSYYPPEIIRIRDIQAIIDAMCEMIYKCDLGYQAIYDNSTLISMNLERIKEWESMLNITPEQTVPDNEVTPEMLQKRRDVILARLKGLNKLNTKTINDIVHSFTRGDATSWFENGVIYVVINLPKEDKTYNFDEVERELKRRVPAHLGMEVSRKYYQWNKIKEATTSWGNVNNNFDNWQTVLYFIPFDDNNPDIVTLLQFGNKT